MRGNYESLVALAEKVERMEAVKNDFIVPSRNLQMISTDEGNQMQMAGADDVSTMGITGHAHGQIAAKLDIPKKYYDRMGAVPELRAANVNAWLGRSDDKRMVRTIDGNVRALLSDRFKPFDNYDILSTVMPIFQEFPGIQINTNALTETHMYLQATFPSMEAEVKQGDVVRWGVTMRNSEVGASSVAVESMIWRLVCKNGMIGQSMLKRYHSGRSLDLNDDQTYSVFASDTIQADIQAFRLQLRDIMKHSLSDGAFQAQVAKLRETTDETIEKPKDVVENVTKRFGLSEGEGEKALHNLYKGNEFSQWGMANALTALAHDIENPDRQYKMEKLGNDVIELKPGQWQELVA